MKGITIVLFGLLTLSQCRNFNKNNSLNVDSSREVLLITRDTLIDRIDSLLIQNSEVDMAKLSSLFLKSFRHDGNTPFITFEGVKDSLSKLTIHKYISVKMGSACYSTYLLSFPYENDNIYSALMLLNQSQTDGLIIFESVNDEMGYLRKAFFSTKKIKVSQNEIDYYDYDSDGNILKEKDILDTQVMHSNEYYIANDSFKKCEIKKDRLDLNGIYNAINVADYGISFEFKNDSIIYTEIGDMGKVYNQYLLTVANNGSGITDLKFAKTLNGLTGAASKAEIFGSIHKINGDIYVQSSYIQSKFKVHKLILEHQK